MKQVVEKLEANARLIKYTVKECAHTSLKKSATY